MGHRTGFSYCQLSWSPVFKLSTNYAFKNRVVHISGFIFWIVHKSGSGFLKVSLTWGTLYRALYQKGTQLPSHWILQLLPGKRPDNCKTRVKTRVKTRLIILLNLAVCNNLFGKSLYPFVVAATASSSYFVQSYKLIYCFTFPL